MGLPESTNTTVAVITGGHAFDVPAFHALFGNIPGTDCYIQHLEDYAADVGNVGDQYDVLLFTPCPWAFMETICRPLSPFENILGDERCIMLFLPPKPVRIVARGQHPS